MSSRSAARGILRRSASLGHRVMNPSRRAARAPISTGMAFDIDAALRHLIQQEGSDLHLKAGAPPMTRVHGKLSPIEGAEPLSNEATEGALAHMLQDKGKLDEFGEEGEVDF